MNDEDKKLLEKAKEVLNISNLEELAIMTGYAKTSVNNWYKSGFSDRAKYKIKNLLDKHSKNTTLHVSPSSHVENELPPEILELIEDYKKLDEDKKEIYRLKIKKDAIEKELKEKGVND